MYHQETCSKPCLRHSDVSVRIDIEGYSSRGEDGLATADVLKLFRNSSDTSDLEFVPLNYGAEGSCEMSIKDVNGKAVALTIFRPCQHEQFWSDVFSLLKRGPYLAFMPGSPEPVLVNPEVADHLPEGMADALGVPKLVSTVAETVSGIVGN